MKRKHYSAGTIHHKTFDASPYEIPNSSILSLTEDQTKVFEKKLDVNKQPFGQCENFPDQCINCHHLMPWVNRRN